MARGLWNILRTLGMVQGNLDGLPDRYTLVQAPPEGEFSHLPTGGFLRNRTRLGAAVHAGEVLGVMVDVFGHKLTEITAPIDGIVLSYRTIPVARVGEWGYSVVRVMGTAVFETGMEAAMGGQA